VYRDLLFALGLVAGGIAFGTQLNVLTVVLPGMRREDGATGIRLHTILLDHAAHTATAIPAVSLLGMTALLLLIDGDLQGSQRAALLAALAGVVGVTITTVGFQVPANKRIRGGFVAPSDYRAALERWRRVHLWRTVSGAIAFAGVVVAALG
jgi:hypothetical protein